MTDKTKFWYLEDFNAFKDLPENILKEISEKTVMCDFYKDEFIYLPDDKSETLFLLKEGKVKVANYSDEGKEIIKTILQPGEIFGELSLFEEGRRSDFAQAIDQVKVCKMSKADFEELMAKHANFSLRVNKIIGLRLIKIERRLESLVFKDVRSRIIEFLIDLAREKGEKVGFEVLIKSNLTHQDIANLLATSRQTVTSVLNELKADNLIHFDRRKILIRNLDKLRQEIEVLQPTKQTKR